MVTRTLTGASVEEVLDGWPREARKVAEQVIEQYGEPDEAMPSRLLWHGTGPWKRAAVNRDGVPHRFPKPHTDYFEQFIDYRTPAERVGDIAAFDGSVRVERTRGELGARCDKEPMNYLAVNLAHDVATGQRSVADARHAYTEKAAAQMMGRDDPYTTGFVFEPSGGDTADRDAPFSA